MNSSDIYTALSLAVPIGWQYPTDEYDYVIEVDKVIHKLHWDRNQPSPKGGWPATWM